MLILDAGAFVAAERGNREVLARVKHERRLGRTPLTNGGVVAQVWRGGHGKQAPLAQLLASAEIAPVDDQLGKLAGMLLALTGGSDAIDAAVAVAQRAMADASEIVLGGVRLRSEAHVIRYPDRYQDARGQKMWDTVWTVVAELDQSRT